MRSKGGLLYDGLFTFLVQTASIVGSLVLGIITARVLGPMGKGIYVLPIVQAGFVSSAFGGLSNATSYCLLNGNAGRQIIRPLAIATLLFVTAGAIGVLALAAIGQDMWAAPAAIASLPAAAAVFAVRGYVTGINRVRFVSTLSVGSVIATLVLTSVGLFLVARTPAVAIVAWVASTTFVGAAAWIAMLLHARRYGAVGNPIPLRDFIAMALKNGAAALVSLLNYRADLYLVAIMLPTMDLGLYSVATSAPQALLFPAQVAAIVTSPKIGGLDRRSAALLAARCSRHCLLISILLCAGVFFLAPFIIGAFYGDAFLPLVPALRILLFGVVALSLAAPIAAYYTLKLAKPEIPLVLAGVSAAICIAGTIVFIPRFGIVGAAAASSAGYIVSQILALWYFNRNTGLNLRGVLIPTWVDLQVYTKFARQLQSDGTRLFKRNARAQV